MAEANDIVRPVAEKALPLRRARYWVQAVEYQARRVLATCAAPFDLRTALHMEEQFLLTATEKARRWLRAARKSGGGSADTGRRIKAFLKATSVASDMRNFREHDDEYDLGRGRNNDRVNTTVDVDGDRLQVTHQVNVTYREDSPRIGAMADTEGLHILLGGRFDVIAAMAAAGQLAAYLVAQESLPNSGDPAVARFAGPSFPAAVTAQ